MTLGSASKVGHSGAAEADDPGAGKGSCGCGGAAGGGGAAAGAVGAASGAQGSSPPAITKPSS